MGSVGTVALALRLVLAVVFVVAAVGKLLDREGSIKALADFGVGGRIGQIGGTILPYAELATALALIFPGTATLGAIAAIALLGIFIVGISVALAQGREPDCHCFGQIHSEPAGVKTIVRNVVLAGLAVVVLAGGPGPALDTWISDRTSQELVAVGMGLLAFLSLSAAVWLFRENRRLRTSLAEAEAGFPAIGLPIGAQAPKFSLRSNEGRKVSLDSLTARGKPVLLVFVGPRCGPCWLLMPHLAQWQQTLSDRLTVAMVSHGTRRDNEEAIEEHAIVGLFLHNGGKLLDAYRVKNTPTAVLVDTDGRIASASVQGSRPIEPLIRSILLEQDSEPAGIRSQLEAAFVPA
jgi:peroxiredoxin